MALMSSERGDTWQTWAICVHVVTGTWDNRAEGSGSTANLALLLVWKGISHPHSTPMEQHSDSATENLSTNRQRKHSSTARHSTCSTFLPWPKSQQGRLPHSAAPGSTGRKVQFQPRIAGELPREDLVAELTPWQWQGKLNPQEQPSPGALLPRVH